MSAHFNQLTPAQAEALALLAEECGELVQAIGKTLRHGANSTHPTRPEEPNIEAVAREFGDVLAAFAVLDGAFPIDGTWTLKHIASVARAEKLDRVTRYLHHAITKEAP